MINDGDYQKVWRGDGEWWCWFYFYFFFQCWRCVVKNVWRLTAALGYTPWNALGESRKVTDEAADPSWPESAPERHLPRIPDIKYRRYATTLHWGGVEKEEPLLPQTTSSSLSHFLSRQSSWSRFLCCSLHFFFFFLFSPFLQQNLKHCLSFLLFIFDFVARLHSWIRIGTEKWNNSLLFHLSVLFHEFTFIFSRESVYYNGTDFTIKSIFESTKVSKNLFL